jgi:hypothetical protein
MQAMQNLNRRVLSILLLVSISFCGCAVNRTVPTKQLDASIVPADFNPEKHVLLVVEMPKKNKPTERNEKATMEMESLLKKFYPYKFEIVSMEDIRSKRSRYADTAVYKYAMLNNLTGVTHTTTYTPVNSDGSLGHSSSPSATTTYISYRFLDRANNREYGESYKSAWLKTSVEAFANTIKKSKHI